ncbi:MAG TPA: cache domain-containing protein [Noviherbaspirillum sp.]|nr:cache domain-containing protein [Noviherbaspirillum sp.]
MKKIFIGMLMVLCSFGLQAAAGAAERGNAEDAVALVKQAIAYIKANGRDKAFAEFSSPSGKFRDRDMYIMVYDLQGNNKAHGANPRLVGKNLSGIKDADGKALFNAFLDSVNSPKGGGWVDYKWPNPVTGAIEPKTTYVEKFEDIMLGCGIYK